MTGRVSIPELRGHLADGGSFEWSMLSDRQLATVLALIEAVEAARRIERAYAAMMDYDGREVPDELSRPLWNALDDSHDVLARFDFGNESS